MEKYFKEHMKKHESETRNFSKARDFDEIVSNNERSELNIEKENYADEDKKKLLTIYELYKGYAIALN